MSKRPKKAIILLSGGLDSATTLFFAKARGYTCLCLIIDYGQRHSREIKSARAVASVAGVPFEVLKVRFPWKGSALTDWSMSIPSGRSIRRMGRDIPSTYVPARNTIFLSLALGCAEAVGAEAIYIGANAVDFSGYPDCRPDYYRAFQKAAGLGTRTGARGRPVIIETPLIRKTKAQIIRMGTRLGVPYRLTWSCYRGGSAPCRRCDSCILRAKGFQEAGRRDPLLDPR